MNTPITHATDISVLIVGAGPTGLILACDLARRGVDFRIVEKATEYAVGSRGKGLQPRSMEVLDDLGVIDRILAHGQFHLPIRSYDGTTVLGDRDMHEGRHPTPDVPYESTLIIPQWRVEETLRLRLAEWGARVELATELVAFEQNEDYVTATLQKGDTREQVRSKYLIAADGGHSFVRKSLNVGFEGETWKEERLMTGDVRVDGLDRDHWHMWPKHKDGFVALCPLRSTEMFQFQAQVLPQEEARAIAGNLSTDHQRAYRTHRFETLRCDLALALSSERKNGGPIPGSGESSLQAMQLTFTRQPGEWA